MKTILDTSERRRFNFLFSLPSLPPSSSSLHQMPFSHLCLPSSSFSFSILPYSVSFYLFLSHLFLSSSLFLLIFFSFFLFLSCFLPSSLKQDSRGMENRRDLFFVLELSPPLFLSLSCFFVQDIQN